MMILKNLKILIMVYFFILIPGINFAQYPDTLWTKKYDVSIDLDEGKCVKETDDGGYIITGTSVPDGMTSAIDLTLLKTDNSGNLLWTKTYDREFIEEGLAIEQTYDGGFAIGGRALNVTGPIPTTNHESQVWLLKIDSSGDTLWTKSYGDTGHDYCTSIIQTQDSGFVLVGTQNSKFAYPPNCYLDCNDYYSSTVWMLKTDKNGDTLWSKNYLESSYGNCVKQIADNGFIVTGTQVSGNQMDIALIKTDANGNMIWTRIIGAPDSLDFGKYVQPLEDGYLITGHTGPLSGYVDAFLIKTDLSGNVVWKKTYGGFGGDMSDSGNYLEVCADGSIIVTGIKNAQWYIHYGDMWVFQTDPIGNLLWEKVYDVKVNDYSWSGTLTTDNNFVLTGMTASTGIGDGSIFLAKISQIQTAIPKNENKKMDYALFQNYPNPFNSGTKIAYFLQNAGYVILKIYDVLGREVHTLVNEYQNAGTKSVHFEGENISSGIYFYKIEVDNKFSKIRKMILMQ